MKKNVKTTKRENRAAFEAQAPMIDRDKEFGDKPTALAKMGVFSTLLRQPTVDAAQLLGGGKTEWINAMDEINALFPTGGNFSRPFFVLRAWHFTSKTATQPDRMGMKIATPDEKIWHISLSFPFSDETGEPIYPDRAVVLEHFEASTTAVGLMQFEKVDRGQNNPYWRLIYSDEHSMELAGESLERPPVDENAPPF